MSERRTQGTSCPLIPQARVHMDVCQPCRFFRGASTYTVSGDDGKPKLLPSGRPLPTEWAIVCNYPRDGSYVAPLAREEVPGD